MVSRFSATSRFAALLCVCFLFSQAIVVQAQEDDHNIIIDHASVDIRFVRAKGEKGAVKIEETAATTYLCQDYKTAIPVAELYNDQTPIDEVKVYTDGKHNKAIRPKYEYYSQEGIFFSDARICYLRIPFDKRGATAEVVFEKTTLNPIYFNPIYFTQEQREIKQKTVTLTVPDWMTIDLKEMNFEGWKIERSKEEKDGATLYTYVLREAQPIKREANSPGPSYFQPHLLIMMKESRLDGITKTYFKTLADQYSWCRQLVDSIGNDKDAVRQKAQEITAGKTTDTDKVKAIYYWVQQHIRYIAYEDGIAAFKPEKSQEVLRKKYGDCKGMANLLVSMLRALNYDARLCWLGTNHLAYDHSTPALCVDNHMIAAWMKDGKPVFLDGTEKFIGFGETAERIQGRQILIEDGAGYLLQHAPVCQHLQNTCTEQRILHVDGQDLIGKVTHIYKGENKERLLQLLDYLTLDRRDEVLRKYLSGGNPSYQISNLSITDYKDYSRDVIVSYDVVQKGAFTKFGADQYLDLDNRRQFADCAIDTAKHHLPFLFPFKNHQVLDVVITLPAGATAKSLPPDIDRNKPAYGYSAKWQQQQGAELSYHSESWIEQPYFKVAQFPALNQDIQDLKKFYNAQPELIF